MARARCRGCAAPFLPSSPFGGSRSRCAARKRPRGFQRASCRSAAVAAALSSNCNGRVADVPLTRDCKSSCESPFKASRIFDDANALACEPSGTDASLIAAVRIIVYASGIDWDHGHWRGPACTLGGTPRVRSAWCTTLRRHPDCTHDDGRESDTLQDAKQSQSS